MRHAAFTGELRAQIVEHDIICIRRDDVLAWLAATDGSARYERPSSGQERDETLRLGYHADGRTEGVFHNFMMRNLALHRKDTVMTTTLDHQRMAPVVDPATPAEQTTSVTREPAQWLSLGAVAGPVLFTLAWFVLGFLSPGLVFAGSPPIPASPITAPISGLGLGPTGPVMNAAFVLSGVLLIAGVLGIFTTSELDGTRLVARGASAALLALSGVGLVIAGLFTLEAPIPHFAGFLLATGVPILSFVVAGSVFRGIPGWRRFGTWLRLGSPLTLVLLVLSQLTFDQATIVAGEGVAGLTSRLLAVEVLAWFAVMGWLAFRGDPRRA